MTTKMRLIICKICPSSDSQAVGRWLYFLREYKSTLQNGLWLSSLSKLHNMIKLHTTGVTNGGLGIGQIIRAPKISRF